MCISVSTLWRDLQCSNRSPHTRLRHTEALSQALPPLKRCCPFEFRDTVAAMSSCKRLLLCLSVLLVATNFARGSPNLLKNPQCNAKNLQKTDIAIAKLFGFGPHGRLFPENHQQLKRYCQDTTKLVTQIDTFFKTCFKKEVRDLANIIIYSIKNSVRQFCRKKTKKLTKLLESTPCINKHFIKDDSCLVLFANRTKQLIHWNGDDQVKIHHSCCDYVASLHCTERLIDSVDCIRNNKEILLDFIRGIFGSFTDFMCGEYNEFTTKCDEIGPPPKPKTPNRKSYNSFFFVLLDLMDSFKSFSIPNE